MMYHVRLERVVWFWGFSRRTRKVKKKWIRSSISVKVEGGDPNCWQEQLDKISDEFRLGRSWKFLEIVQEPQE